MAMSVGEAEAAAARRLEEPEGVHLGAARGFVRGFVPAGDAVAAIAPIPALLDLVLPPAIRAAAIDLVALAHGGLLCRRSGGDPLGGTQARAPSPGVGGDLRRRGDDPLGDDEPKPRAPATDADRRLGRAGAAATLGLEEPLDDPVLEGVVAEDDQPATGAKEVERGREPLLERGELLVHGDAQGLEHPSGGMEPPAARGAAPRPPPAPPGPLLPAPGPCGA